MSANRPISCLLLVILFLWSTILMVFDLSNASVLPNQDLTIVLNVDANCLTGKANINIPAGVPVDIDISGLDVDTLTVDGLVLEIAEDDGGIVSLERSELARSVDVQYTLDCEGTDRCMINGQGVILTAKWHPELNHDTIFRLEAQIPNRFEAISEADAITTIETATGKTVRFYFPHSARSINFIAGPYHVETESFGNNQKLFSYFFSEDQALASNYREKAKQYLERYIKFIGPYPYKRFSIVENLLPTGYAMPTFTLLGQSVVRLPFIVNTSLGHEVLHSWFGNSIRVKAEGGNWCEGLTTYLADHSFAVDKGEGAEFRKRQLVNYQSYVAEDNATSLAEFSGAGFSRTRSQRALRAVGYAKSSMVFHMLKKKFGDKLFQASLRDFYSRMSGKFADWHDLQVSFESITSSDLNQYFDQWLVRNDMPEIETRTVELIEKEGQLYLSLLIRQGSKIPYHLSVPLVIEGEDGSITKQITLSETERAMEIPLSFYPKRVVVDPGYDLARQLSPGELPPVWSRFAGAKQSLAVVGSSAEFNLYVPLIEMLKAGGTEVVNADEINDKNLVDNALIFLGSSSVVAQGLFAKIESPSSGLSIDVRNNPLNPDLVAVLVSASSGEEVALGTVKLSHYGRYSDLHFKGGRALVKKIKTTTLGQSHSIDEELAGIKVKETLSVKRIIEELLVKRVIYVGEAHTKYEDHRLQLRVIRELFNRDHNLAIGMEMFPRSAQSVIDQFIAGEIDEKTFLKKSGYFKVWGYDYRLYREIINFARQHKIRVVGLNIEKEKVAKVFKEGGFLGLTSEEKILIPIDRKLDMTGYPERLGNIFKHHQGVGGDFSGFLQAQAIWDETMAQAIFDDLVGHPQDRLVVLAGNGHVIKTNGIPPRVKRRIEVEQAVVASSEGSEILAEELDYVFFVPARSLPPKPLIGIVMEKKGEEVVITDLSAQGGAEKAGVLKGDIILGLDDEPISAMEDVKILMLAKKKGENVKLSIKRPHLIFPDEEIVFDVKL